MDEKTITVAATTPSREDILLEEIQRLQAYSEGLELRLQRARDQLRLADERAALQRIHIGQLQNQLGQGVCRELQTPAPPRKPAQPAVQEEIEPPDEEPAAPAPRPSPDNGCRIGLAAIPVDKNRMANQICQHPSCTDRVPNYGARYCGKRCMMQHRHEYARQLKGQP